MTQLKKVLTEDRDAIRGEQQRLVEAETQLKQAQDLAAKREQELEKMQELRQKTDSTQARIDAIQDDQGSNVESEAELGRLRQLKKNLQTYFENANKEVVRLEKQAKKKKQNRKRSTGSKQASRQKKVKEIPLKKG